MPVLDHIVYATPNLDATAADLTGRLGISPASGGSHPGMGTRNVIYGLGDGQYFEVIGPDEAQDVAPRWFGIGALTRPRLAGWAIRTEKIDFVVAGARERGYDPGEPVAMSRQAEAGLLSWRLTMPRETLVPFLIEWGDTPHPSTRELPRVTLESFAGEHPDPIALRQTLGTLGVGLTLRRAPQTRLTAVLAGPGGRVELY
jgi:hypothetical protein